MSNVYDQAARFAVKLDPGGFCRWLLPGLDPAIGFREWLDTRTLPFPGEQDRTCDTVAALGRAGEMAAPWALVIESQSEPDADMLDRLLEYLARFRREMRHGPQRRDKYQVVAAVLNLTGPAQPDLLEMALPGLFAPGLALRAVVKTLRAEDAAATLDGIAAGRVARCMLPWISLMLGADRNDTIERWKALAAVEPGRRVRADYGALALIFATLAGRRAQWTHALEGWNVIECSIVDEWKEQVRAQLEAQARAEGEARGEVRGEARGEAKGMLRGKRDDLEQVLQIRFPAPVPADLEAAIRDQADLDTLSRWFEAAVRAASLDEFRAVVGR